MRSISFALLLALATPTLSYAQDEASRAEYIRLSSELQRLAEKNAWPGVEMTFQRILASGVDPSQDDYYIAAQASRAAGDVAAARERLLKANEPEERREVVDWLWELDSSFGTVSLTGDVGKIALEPDSMPFNPDRAAAVRFAQAKIDASGIFEGYLPEGSYTFGTFEFAVQPRVQAVRIDATGASTLVAKPPKEEKPPKEAKPPKPPKEPRVAKAPKEPGERPYTLGAFLGVGNNFGGIVGGGVQVVGRFGSGVVALSGGIGYDFPYTALGLSANVRVYPQKFIYLAGGVAPLVWYKGEIAAPEGAVAHGPQVLAGLDLPLGPMLIDAYIGGGVASAQGKMRPGLSGGVGIGVGF